MTLVVALTGQGCGAARACTGVGGFDGVGVEIPRALFVRSGSVAFKVCAANDCVSARLPLGRVPEGPVGRRAGVTFDDLGRDCEPGPVTVTVKLSGPDRRPVAANRQEVELVRSYPNGKSCDGDGYVSGLPRDAGGRPPLSKVVRHVASRPKHGHEHVRGLHPSMLFISASDLRFGADAARWNVRHVQLSIWLPYWLPLGFCAFLALNAVVASW